MVRRAGVQQILSCTFRDGNDSVPAASHAVFERGEKTSFALQGERHLRNRAKFTSWLAMVAPAVTNPAWRPMSFTNPIPPATLLASVCAQSSTRHASSTAVR